MRKLLLALLLPLIAFVMIGASAVPADAAPAPAHVPSMVPDIDDGEQQQQATDRYVNSKYLPVERWGEMGLHTRVNWMNPIGGMQTQSNRGLTGVLLTFGNQMWGWATDWTQAATEFDVFNTSFGFHVDKFSGIIGTALRDNPMVFALAGAILIGVVLWRSIRSGGGSRGWVKVIHAGIVMALVSVMSVQAAAGTAGDVPNRYSPQVGSPVWLASALTGAVNTTASSVVEPVMAGMRAMTVSERESDTGWECPAMTEAALDLARTSSGTVEPAPGTLAVTTVLNTMWANTALPTYSAIQFGSGNDYADFVWCRQLERQSSAYSFTRLTLLSHAVTGEGGAKLRDFGFTSLDSPMLTDVSDNEVDDRVLIAWAACSPDGLPAGPNDFTVRKGWREKIGGAEWITPQACWRMWSAESEDDAKLDEFNVGGEEGDVTAITENDQVRDYLFNLHGRVWDSNGAAGSAFIYVIGSIIATGVFGLLSLAVFGSKIAMLAIVAFLFIVLIVSLFQRVSFGQAMSRPMQRLLGVVVFAFASALLLAVIGAFSLVISTLGSLFGDPGTFGNLAWVAMSPALAVLAVHFVFTKALRVPSPMTPKGALAWGVAGGAAGSVIGGAISNRLNQVGRRALRQGADNLLSRSKATSWAVSDTRRHIDAIRGTGDAGPKVRGGGEAGALVDGTKDAAKASPEELKTWEADAAAEYAATHGRGARRRQLREQRVAALQEALKSNRDGIGLPPGMDPGAALLKHGAAQRLLRTNADAEWADSGATDESDFFLTPGEEPPAPKPAQEIAWNEAKWEDLDKAGRAAAVRAYRQSRPSIRTRIGDRMLGLGPGGVAKAVGKGVAVGGTGAALAVVAAPAVPVAAAALAVHRAKRRRTERADHISKYVQSKAEEKAAAAAAAAEAEKPRTSEETEKEEGQQ